MAFTIGQEVKYAGEKGKVVGIISAFMIPGLFPQGIDDIRPEYLSDGLDKSKWEKDSLLIKTKNNIARVLFEDVERIK